MPRYEGLFPRPVWSERTWKLFRRYENRARVAEQLWQQYLGASSIDARRADGHWRLYRQASQSARRAFEAFRQAKDGEAGQ
jgi:hypothetical protein